MSALGAQAVADAQARLGIDEAQTELRLAKDRAQEHAAETQRLADLLQAEKDAAVGAAEAAAAKIEELTATLKAEHAATASTAAKDRSDLGKEMTKLRAELEEVRARTDATDIELEKSERARRELDTELHIERRERTHIEQMRSEEAKAARSRIAGMERELAELRSKPAAAAIPAQRPAPVIHEAVNGVNGAHQFPEPTPEPRPVSSTNSSTNTSARPSGKDAFYQVADRLTDRGADRDHPLLSDHGPTRNGAAREVADHLGYTEATLRKYAKAYHEDRS